MATRAPERGGLERRQVARAEVLATDATGFLARTEAYPDPWPTGPFPAPPDRSRPEEGRLRIEAVADTVLRVRYAPGSLVRDGGRHMLVSAPSRATKARSATWRLGDQFLCGRSILAAPLFEPGGCRRAYLPPGPGPSGGPGSGSVARGGCRPPTASAPCRCTCGKER